MHDASDEAIETRLDELDACVTVTPFSHAFYRLIADMASMADGEDAVRLALMGLLDVELRHHRQLQQMAERQVVSLGDLQDAADKHRIGIAAVLRFAQGLPETQVMATAAGKLIAAQCEYYLRHTHAVVEALEDVLGLGVDQPLIQFALGYSRYVLAVETYGQPGRGDLDLRVHDTLEYQLQCLRAVSALEDGLSGGDFDIQLCWWIGVILEAAGLTEAARDAYDKSASLMKLLAPDELSEEWSEEALQPQSTITEDEVRLAAEYFRGRFHPSQLLGSEPDDQ